MHALIQNRIAIRKYIIRTFSVLLFFTNPFMYAEAQQISGLYDVFKTFPQATRIYKINSTWYELLDSKNKRIAWVISSEPYTNNIIGYNDVTPIYVLMDLDYKIQKIGMLRNKETELYIRKLEYFNFFNAWNDFILDQVDTSNVSLDAYTGATVTAVAIKKNLSVTAENAMKNVPEK